MALHVKTVFAGQTRKLLFEQLVFGEWQRNAAAQTGRMMVMLVKQPAQFQPVLPAGLQTLDDPDFFEQAYGTVHCRAVDCFAPFYEFVHGKRSGALESAENCQPGIGQAATGLLEIIGK